MTLTVTPGGASDDALLTLAAFKSYADARNWDYSSFDDETAIEPAIRVGTVFVGRRRRPDRRPFDPMARKEGERLTAPSVAAVGGQGR